MSCRPFLRRIGRDSHSRKPAALDLGSTSRARLRRCMVDEWKYVQTRENGTVFEVTLPREAVVRRAGGYTADGAQPFRLG